MTSHTEKVVGDAIGDYELIDELGFGAAGKIFVAKHVESGEQVAMKLLRHDALTNEDIHGRFIREISVAQKLNDPHIVSYRDCGVEDDILYFTMEYVPWGSLADVLRIRSRLPWRETCECGVQICQGLQHLHESNIVHRDLKPANIFLSDDGRLKLGDFGLARDFQSHRLTAGGTTVGTGRYIAPEQARGDSNIDGRTDLYALGCDLFELLVGHTPYDPHDAHDPVSFGELMRRHVEDPVPKVIDRIPSCPPALSKLIERLLEKDRKQRPSSAVEVADALQRILQTSEDSTVDPPSDAGSHLTERLRISPVVAANQISTRGIVVMGLVVMAMIAVAAVML